MAMSSFGRAWIGGPLAEWVLNSGSFSSSSLGENDPAPRSRRLTSISVTGSAPSSSTSGKTKGVGSVGPSAASLFFESAKTNKRVFLDGGEIGERDSDVVVWMGPGWKAVESDRSAR